MRSITEIEMAIAELRRRWPAHSVAPSLADRLELLEAELEEARAKAAGSNA